MVSDNQNIKLTLKTIVAIAIPFLRQNKRLQVHKAVSHIKLYFLFAKFGMFRNSDNATLSFGF